MFSLLHSVKRQEKHLEFLKDSQIDKEVPFPPVEDVKYLSFLQTRKLIGWSCSGMSF